MKKLDKKIDELTKLIRKLINLALELGTLIAVIKMILDSIRQGKGLSPLNLIEVYHRFITLSSGKEENI